MNFLNSALENWHVLFINDNQLGKFCKFQLLLGQMEVAYVIPVLFLNNSLGTQLLPITIESADFKMAMESAENHSAQSLLSKW